MINIALINQGWQTRTTITSILSRWLSNNDLSLKKRDNHNDAPLK